MGRSPAKPTPWRALAEQLVDEGCESIYLTRLRAQHDVRAHVDTLAEEVAEEMARPSAGRRVASTTRSRASSGTGSGLLRLRRPCCV